MGRCIIQRISVEVISVLPKALLDAIYPIGYIYMTSLNSLTPSDLFGGDWEQVNGMYLMTCDDNPGDVVGQNNNTLPLTGNMGGTKVDAPSHLHEYYMEKKTGSNSSGGYTATGNVGSGSGTCWTEYECGSGAYSSTGNDGKCGFYKYEDCDTHTHSMNHIHEYTLKTFNTIIWKRIG